MRTTLSLMVLAAAGFAGTAEAQQGVIDGRVTAQGTNLPLPGVVVRLDDDGRSWITDGRGGFRIAAVPAGEHTLAASLVGYGATELAVTVEAGETAEVSIVLTEAPIALAPVEVFGERVRRGLESTVGSVAALDGAAIRGAGLNDLRDALRMVANARDADWIDAGILIRGINSEGVAGPSGSPLATFYVDGVAQTMDAARRGPTGGWDVRQMEVWRGPQSTLSGRNALAGKVEIRTNDPTMSWEVAAQAELGNNAQNQQAVAVSGPLIADRLAFRVAAERRRADGEVGYPLYDGMPRLDERANDDYRHLRAKLLFVPSGDPTGLRALLTVSTTYSSPAYGDVDGPSADGSSAGLDGTVAFEDRLWGFQSPPLFVEARSARSDQASLELSLPVSGRWTLYSTSTWLDGSTKRPSVDLASDGEIADTELSQEVRAVFSGANVEAVLGAYWLDGEGETSREQQRPWETFLRVDTGESSFTNTALFGEVRWRVVPALTLIAGARYDREDQAFSNLAREFEDGSMISESARATDSDFDAFLPKLGASFDVSDRSTLGVTVQKAYRAGGSAIDFLTGEAYDYDPESAWNYEVAWRGRSSDDRIRYAVNVFHLDWQDQQINVPQVPGDFSSDIILNAGESTVTGAELELAARLSEQVTAFGSIGYANTEFQDFSFLLGGSELDLAGEPFPQAPDLTAVAGFEYRARAGWFAAADASYTGKTLSRSLLEGGPYDELASYALVNLRAGFDIGAFSLTGYVENATDEDYFVYRYDDRAFQLATLGAGRAFGLIVNTRLTDF